METYPSEGLRAELSVKLGLSDRQLQMWFCHRRLKDRKAPSVKRPRKSSPAMAGAASVNPVGGNGEKKESSSGLGMGSNVYAHPVDMRLAAQRPGVAIARIGVNLPSMKRLYESQQSIAELRAIALVEAQVGEPLKEDGPILGMEFDPLPPGAFGAPIGKIGFYEIETTHDVNCFLGIMDNLFNGYWVYCCLCFLREAIYSFLLSRKYCC